uniref:EMB2369 (EMBRYO DEFECTIVE 2369) n=1 Tax=Arundo donax TaxID=35708 RepID=A0A0A9D3J4_ARUDO
MQYTQLLPILILDLSGT